MAELAVKGGKPLRTKPFSQWPVLNAGDRERLLDVLESRNLGGIPFPNKYARVFAEKFSSIMNVSHALLVANGTVALSIALRAAGVKAGDEVITTGYTWVATPASVVYINAVPVLVDISANNYCIDPACVESAITDKSRAIIVVHLANQVCDMDTIMKIAKQYGLVVIEDCAHAHFAQWKGKCVGSIGHLGTFSFESSKIMTSGEGGLITTNDTDLYERCLSLTNCGRKENGYNNFKGRYLGWNYRITEMQAAVLIGQLECMDELTKRRENNVKYFYNRLKDVKGIAPIKDDPDITRRQYYEVICKYDRKQFNDLPRDRFSEAVTAEGVEIEGQFYVTLTRNPLFHVTADEWPLIRERYGDRIGPDSAHLPECDKASYEEALWLHYPLFSGDQRDVDDIIDAIKKVQAYAEEIK